MIFNNGGPMSNFQFKMNQNPLGIEVVSDGFANYNNTPGVLEKVKIHCRLNSAAENGQPISGNVITVQAGLRTSADLWYFQFPVLMHVCLQQQDPSLLDKNSLQQSWYSLQGDANHQLKLPAMSPQLSNPGLVSQRLQDNHVYLVGT